MTTLLKKIKYDVIFEPLAGEVECGDQYFIKELDDSVLFAVADGLGHGKEAAYAAKKALEILAKNPRESLENLLKLCHEALHGTRGSAMTMAKIDANNKLMYMAVGNVEGVCWKTDSNAKLTHQTIIVEGGIVGDRIPKFIKVNQIAMAPGDIFILATDGIYTGFEIEPPRLELPEKIAKEIFTTYRNKKDDGLIFVLQLL